MNQKSWRTAQVFAVLQLLTAFALHGVYTNQLWHLSPDQTMSLKGVAVSVAAFLFILLPFAAVTGLFRYKRWGYYALILFPLVAIVFGTIPIPYASYFFSSDIQLMSKVIVAVNATLAIAGVVLLRNSRSKTDASQ